jgi:hypothetical protein
LCKAHKKTILVEENVCPSLLWAWRWA